jgi:nitrogen fixation NifU-like protein
MTAIPQGKTIAEASSLKNTDIAKHLNLPPVKLHCSMLAEDAIKVMLAAAALFHLSLHQFIHFLGRHQ